MIPASKVAVAYLTFLLHLSYARFQFLDRRPAILTEAMSDFIQFFEERIGLAPSIDHEFSLSVLSNPSSVPRLPRDAGIEPALLKCDVMFLADRCLTFRDSVVTSSTRIEMSVKNYWY
jgi:hypothetical protein